MNRSEKVFTKHFCSLSEYKRTLGLLLIICVVINLLAGCRTIPRPDREPMRMEIRAESNKTIKKMIDADPELQEDLENAAGYFTGRVTGVKAPFVGGGIGFGILHDKTDNSRTYINIRRVDLGLGLSSGVFRVLVLFPEHASLKKYKKGFFKLGLTSETAAGESVNILVSELDENVPVYFLRESGAAMTAGAKAVRLVVNEDLTDTGVSSVSIPNKDYKTSGRQSEGAPKIWTHKMPFLAQNVIDKGYDLPLPYGFGITFARVSQDMKLDSLDVGFNGGPQSPFEFVSFRDAESDNSTWQLKIDSWIFPFMNVYALLGKIDGDAELDVLLDGNGMLEHLDVQCSGFPPNPICPLLKDKEFTLPVDVDFKGDNYGIGTILASGWNNWFVVIPMNISYADMDSSDTDGYAYTIAPRVGRTWNMGKWGNLSTYAGGNYLKTDLTISGTFKVSEVGLDIDYTLDQENTDPWNILFGGNWDFNKRWSFSAEYNGFTGSRESVIMSLVSRF